MQYAVIENSIVVNVIDWDGITQYTSPVGTLVVSSVAGIGDKYEDSKFYYWDEANQVWVERV